MTLEEALIAASDKNVDNDDDLVQDWRDVVKTLRDTVATFPEKVVTALENATEALANETRRFEYTGKPIERRDAAAICAGAARYASLVEEELGLLEKGQTRSIRVILSSVKLKMGIPVI